MSNSPLPPLCLYCHSAPAQEGSPFCCKACETLYEIKSSQDQNPEPQSLSSSLNEEDALIQKHYGQKVGNEIFYSCSVERLACEACVQQLSDLKLIWPYIQDLRWDRSSSTLNISLAFFSHSRLIVSSGYSLECSAFLSN
jgi:hypothetical protein